MNPALKNLVVSPFIMAQLTAIENNLKANAFTAIGSYTTETGEVANYLVRAAVGTESVYGATLAELDGVCFGNLDLKNWVPSKGKNSFAFAEEQFAFCVQAMKDTINKTLSGDRSGAHREGHDRCSRQFAPGVTVDLVTEKVDGIMQPVVTLEGNFIAKGVRLHGVVMKKEVLIEGEKKVVNSGSKVLMDNAIEKEMNSKRVSLRTFSLQEGKFGSISSGSLGL